MIPKKGDWRSSDPGHLKYVSKWYNAVNRRLAKHQVTRGGNILLYQVENECYWADVDYHRKLAEFARRDGIDIPIVVNTDGALANEGLEAIDCYDLYPGVAWDVLN